MRSKKKTYLERSSKLNKSKAVVHLSEDDTKYFADLLASCQDNDLQAFETIFLAKAHLFLTERKAELLDLANDHAPELKEPQQHNESMDVQHSAGETKNDAVLDDCTELSLYDPRNPPIHPRIIIEMLTSDVVNNGLDYNSDSDLDEVGNADIEAIMAGHEHFEDDSVEMSTVNEEDLERDNQRTLFNSESHQTDDDGEDLSSSHQINCAPPDNVLHIGALLQAFHQLAFSYPGGWKKIPGITIESLIEAFPEQLSETLSVEEKNKLCIMAHRITNSQGLYVGYDADSIGIHCAESLNKVDIYGPQCKKQAVVVNNALVKHLKVESMKALLKAIVANQESFMIAADIIGDKLKEDLNKIGKKFNSGMTEFYTEDTTKIVKIIENSGKVAFAESPGLSLMLSKLCLSQKVQDQSKSFFGCSDIVKSHLLHGEVFHPGMCDSTYINTDIPTALSLRPMTPFVLAPLP